MTPSAVAREKERGMLYDVVSVSISTGSVTGIMVNGATRANAEAVINMAVMRRGVETHFYATTGSGSYAVGEDWHGSRPMPDPLLQDSGR